MTIVERIIIESLATNKKNFEEIIGDTGLPELIVTNALPEMIMNELLSYKSGQYSLGNMDKIKEANKYVCREVKDIMSNLVDNNFNDNSENKILKLQKVSMTKTEEKIFFSQLKSLDSFVNQVKSNRKFDNEKTSIKDQKIVFWGQTDYQSLVNQSLNIA